MEPTKKTLCVDGDGEQIATYPDLVRVNAGDDFYVGQELWIVADALPDGEGGLVITLERPDAPR